MSWNAAIMFVVHSGLGGCPIVLQVVGRVWGGGG